ncbi:MAG: endonuclease MutS2 [Ignavibacteriales bacterium]|nr:endonuclease MutS2 [Ignavibacteriales bacterium]
MSQFDNAAERLDLPKILHRIQFYASSDLGREAAEDIEPITDLETISREHNRVSEMKSILEGESTFPIDDIKDIRGAIQRSTIENNLLTPKELLDIVSTLHASRNIKLFIEKRKEYLQELSALTTSISIHKEIEFNILQAIAENAEVRDSASKELRSIRQSIVDKQISIRKALERILKATSEQGMVQEEIVTTRDGRMVIPIKAELKNRFPGFIHSASSSGQTVFVEPSETLTLNNEITELYYQEKREVEKILKALTNQVHAHVESIRSIIEAVTMMDLCFAKARYSIETKSNKPLLKESGSLVIRNGYHPILLLRHQRETIVPLNLEIGNSFTTLLITGPNAGGKSVALKSVGILSLMVQCGIHVPVSPDSEFPVLKKMFVLIGDNQSIENDLSTYSSQIIHLKKITEQTDAHSLVMIDEIGSNTDPTEGGAIAAAVLESITSSGALLIATSHQAALKAFVHNSERMQNGAMEFDQTTLLPTYRFKQGVPGSSYAVEIAQRLGLSQIIIDRARGMLGDQKAKLEELIFELESRSQSLEQKIAAVDAEAKKNKELASNYEIKLKALNFEIREVKKKAIEEAKSIIEHAASTVEKTVKEIRTHHANREVIKDARERLSDLEKKIELLESEMTDTMVEESKKSFQVYVGDLVVLKSGGQSGTVLTLPDKNGNLQVAFNSIKAKVNISNVESISKKNTKETISTSSYSIDKQFTTEVDVRGLYGDEAISTVDKFLDDAVVAGLQRVEIIHGKGTGALKKRIGIFLENDTRVKSMRMGEWNEGGAGITIVELGD